MRVDLTTDLHFYLIIINTYFIMAHNHGAASRSHDLANQGRSSRRRVGVGRSASGGDFVAKYTKYITTCSFRYHYIIGPSMEPQTDIFII